MPLIIDAHQHLACEPHYESIAAYEEDLLKAAEVLHIDRFCISGVGPIHDNHTNEEVEALMKRRPDVVIGMAFFQLGVDPPERVWEFHERGFRGLKFISPRIPYDDETAMPAYEIAREAGMPAYFHTGFLGLGSGPERTCSDWMRPGRLDAVARWLPDYPIVIAHLGFPWFDEAAALMNYHENVYGDLTGDPSSRPAAFFRERLCMTLPYEKLVFGTDSLPRDVHVPWEQQNALVAELGLDEQQLTDFRGGTIAGLFGLAG